MPALKLIGEVPAGVVCAECKAPFTEHDRAARCESKTEIVMVGEYVGRTLRQVCEAFNMRSDASFALYAVEHGEGPDAPRRRWDDPKQIDPYVIRRGDAIRFGIDRFYHPGCWVHAQHREAIALCSQLVKNAGFLDCVLVATVDEADDSITRVLVQTDVGTLEMSMGWPISVNAIKIECMAPGLDLGALFRDEYHVPKNRKSIVAASPLKAEQYLTKLRGALIGAAG